MDQAVLTEAEARLSDWEARAKIWYIIYYFVVGVTTILVVTTAAAQNATLQKLFGEPGVAIVAWLAVVFQAASTFLIPLQKASAYRSAWRALKFAMLEQKDDTIKRAILTGWEKIDTGYSVDSPRQGPQHGS